MSKGDRPVFSTSKTQPVASKKSQSGESETFQQGQGPAKIRLESKGRGGKTVTVIFNLPMNESAATTLMKEMQGKFGCGATLKNSAIELRGDMRPKVEEFFAARGLKTVRAGG